MRLALPAAALLASAGCSLVYQPDDADRPATAAEVDAWISSYYDAALQARAVCSGTTLEHARTLWLGPKASLIARAQALFDTGDVRLHRELAARCLAAIAAASPGCASIDATLLDPEGDCGRAFAGRLDDGADCRSDAECRAGSYCDPGGGVCPGHCSTYRRESELCGDAAPCGYGLTCSCGFGVPPCPTPTCHRSPLAEGMGCAPTGGAPCVAGTFCREPDYTCAPLLGAGASCAVARCRPELRCESDACVVRTPVGFPCAPGLHECVPSAWCDDVTDPLDPACRAFGIAGDTCGPLPSGELADCIDADCLNGFCVALPSFGESCAPPQRCAPLSTSATCNSAGVCGEVCP